MSPRSAEDESDRSEDDFEEGPSGSTTTPNMKRSARACDRCRKSKSKCETAPSGGPECKSCLAAGTECTFSGPSFRRGPPKGYIQALEHRLHQMESMLAAIMSSKDVRAKGVIADLRRDELARSILEGVDSGPFGPSGRLQRSVDPTKDNFFASIVAAAPPRPKSDRSRRQSRMTRESVTQHAPSKLVRPTLEWQDRLSQSLARWSEENSGTDMTSAAHSSTQHPSTTSSNLGTSEEPVRRRRRLNTPSAIPESELERSPTLDDTDKDELDDCADAFGNLSIDENKQVRYHGNTSGVHILAKDGRWHARIKGGIWNFPMARLWPSESLEDSGDAAKFERPDPPLPPPEVQNHLIERYFNYVHPTFPVIEKDEFMEEFKAQIDGYAQLTSADGEPERMQKAPKLLLFAMFAFAAHYLDDDDHTQQHRPRPDIGAHFAADARMVLDTMYQESRTSTCQALTLLGLREFGVGSVEEGWLHIGMALRMAFDLGLNRNSEKWQLHGRPLFTPAEINVRRRIWWGCCLADRYSAQFLGRPMMHESDFSTFLPDVPEDDGKEIWPSTPLPPEWSHIAPVPATPMSSFREVAKLTVIHGDVVEKIYPVNRVLLDPRRKLMEDIHARLVQWSINLPEPLRYSPGSRRPCPAPNVLSLHCYYWAIMLLLHRPFIPKDLDKQVAPGSSVNDPDPIPWKSYDICQGAALQISAFATLYDKTYGLRWGPPLLSTTLQSAGIMHIITLRHRPMDLQAAQGLRECISACDSMKHIWHNAARVQDLLTGAKLHLEVTGVTTAGPSRKRSAQTALDEEDVAVPIHPPDPHTGIPLQVPTQHQGQFSQPHLGIQNPYPTPGVAGDPHGGLLLDLLGPDIAGSSADVPSGYDWWPSVPQWDNIPQTQPHGVYHQYPTLQSESFTFSQQQLSPEFLQGIRDPVLHFPSPHNFQ